MKGAEKPFSAEKAENVFDDVLLGTPQKRLFGSPVVGERSVKSRVDGGVRQSDAGRQATAAGKVFEDVLLARVQKRLFRSPDDGQRSVKARVDGGARPSNAGELVSCGE